MIDSSHKPSEVSSLPNRCSEDRPRSRMAVGSAAVASMDSRSDPGVTPASASGSYDHPLPQGQSTSAGHPHELGWARCPAKFGPANLQSRLERSMTLVAGQSLLGTSTPKPWCRTALAEHTRSLRLLRGALHPDSLDRPSQAPPLVPATNSIRMSWNASRPTCTQGSLRTRCGTLICGVFSQGSAFQVYSHQLPRGLIPALSGYVWRTPPGKPLKPIHHDPIPRSAAVSIPFCHPLSDSRPVPPYTAPYSP